MGAERSPITEVALEDFIAYWAVRPPPTNSFQLRGTHDLLARHKVTLLSTVRVNRQDRFIIHYSASVVLFMVGDKIYSQDIFDFSDDVQTGIFQEAGARSEGMVAFTKILFGLIGAGFATTGWPAAGWLILIGNVGQGLAEIEEETDIGALLRFCGVFLSVRAVLKDRAAVLYDLIFDALVRRVVQDLPEAIDPEAVGKILVGLVAAYFKGRFKKAMTAIRPIVKALATMLLAILATVPKAVELSERDLISQAGRIATVFREHGIDVPLEQLFTISGELAKTEVHAALLDLRNAAQDVDRTTK